VSVPEAIAIAAAGFGAGVINTVVGSGTLLTFPVLLGFGYPAVTANVSNTIGLVPGGASGTIGYRAELEGQRRRVISLGIASLTGALTGSILLLTLPASSFARVVPYLIGGAILLIVLQPWISARLDARRRARGFHGAGWTPVGLFLIGVYGGYFGAAQGILLLGVLSIGLVDALQRINALKNVLATGTNLVAAIVFAFAGPVDWGVAALIAAGSLVGGHVGARVARVLPPWALKLAIVLVGTAAILKLTV
jgi:uncharacterized membrane protein YfcA